MDRIHVELSPDGAVTRRPVVNAHVTEEEERQRASRDEYYYHSQEPYSPDNVANYSAEAMLEVELDAILRGDQTARWRSVHRGAASVKTEAVSTLQPPPPLTVLTSRQTSPTPEEQTRTLKGVLDHGSSSMSHSENRRTRRSAMRHSIDRFFASEERDESAVEGVEEGTEDFSVSRRSNPDAPSVLSPSSAASPAQAESGSLVEVTPTTGSPPRALFIQSRRKATGSTVGTENGERRVSSLGNSSGGVQEVGRRTRNVLQSITVNTIIPMSPESLTKRSSAKPLGRGKHTHVSSPQADEAACSRCDDAGAHLFRSPPDAVQQLMRGAEVTVTCDACDSSLSLVVLCPSNSLPSVRFCPLCGSAVASMRVLVLWTC
ncbi:hypothetical protein ABB37_01747 [Leptomonas pyrrhocoris]|uniref:Uncharacterized protein n=1 Tax=Leptomonas pyrrhocoris TaxID=157538 RepID=A0A0N0DZL8_LEPPY|nr:hypothetical protein ABB37_01747 [Leptomonas pyrrhocoris]KPA85448.1 hypothetical protein ABB37_01747 [Leptomonas pyrrhocoris]|eukprot:XP_015663887.1 hypothetical protein ABB37_01747 [Leptomonas pyrrhocoris]